MSGTTIGEVNINLRMNLAQFQADTVQGTAQATRATQQMAQSMSSQAGEAKASLALLGETIGVSIPRHLRTLIVEIPGVGEALAAAFSSIAVLALIEVTVKVVQKVQELRAKAEEATKAFDDLADAGQADLRKIQEESLQLEIQLDSLTNDHLKALSDQIELIDEQTLDAITKEFEDLGKKADEAIGKLAVGGLSSFFGLGNDQAVKVVQEDLSDILSKVKELRDSGDDNGIGKLLDQKIAELKSFKDVAFENDPHPEVRQKALEQELATLENIQTAYVGINDNAAKRKEIDSDNSAIKAAQDEAQAYNAQLETLKQLETETEGLAGVEQDKYQREITHVQDVIQKWEAYATTVGAAHGTVSVIANQAIQSLNNELAVLQKQEAAAKNLSTLGLNGTGKYKDDQAATTLSQTFNAPKPAYGGTKEAEELYQIQTKSNVATAEAAKLFTATRTESEQYAEQLDVLNALLARGAISQNTYDRELEDLKVKLGQGGIGDGVKYFFEQFTQGTIRPKMLSGFWMQPLRALRTILHQPLRVPKRIGQHTSQTSKK